MAKQEDYLYPLQLAYEAAQRSNCLRRKTGAVLVMDGTPTVLGYNGTPENTLPCSDGGCPRCASETPELQGYERCACVHAEVNAVALAARVGLRTLGAVLFCTLRPCLGCLKTAIQAGISRVVYSESYQMDQELESLWHRIAQESGLIITHQPMADRREG